MSTSRMNDFFESRTYKIITSKVYGIGAAIVIIGCLFKLQHLPGAGLALGSGLIIESLIFLISAFEPIHEEVDWTLVYPELNGIDIEDFDRNQTAKRNDPYFKSSTGQIANSLDEIPNLSPEQLEKLKTSIQKLGDSADKITDLTNVSKASNNLSQRLSDASETTEKFNKTIKLDIEKHESISEKIGEATKNVNSLGSNYKLLSEEVKKSTQQTTSNFNKLNESIQVNYETYNDLSYQVSTTANHYKEKLTKLNQSVDIAENIDNQEREMLINVKQLQEEMKELKTKISSLNEVYNNMLTAVNTTNKDKVA